MRGSAERNLSLNYWFELSEDKAEPALRQRERRVRELLASAGGAAGGAPCR